MKAVAKYNDDGEAYQIEVSERNGHTVSFGMDDRVAIAQSVQQPEGETHAYLGRVSAFMDYVESLPFVESAELETHEGAL